MNRDLRDALKALHDRSPGMSPAAYCAARIRCIELHGRALTAGQRHVLEFCERAAGIGKHAPADALEVADTAKRDQERARLAATPAFAAWEAGRPA